MAPISFLLRVPLFLSLVLLHAASAPRAMTFLLDLACLQETSRAALLGPSANVQPIAPADSPWHRAQVRPQDAPGGLRPLNGCPFFEGSLPEPHPGHPWTEMPRVAILVWPHVSCDVYFSSTTGKMVSLPSQSRIPAIGSRPDNPSMMAETSGDERLMRTWAWCPQPGALVLDDSRELRRGETPIP